MLTGESTSSTYVSPDQRPFVVGLSDKPQAKKPEKQQPKIQISKNK
jgi:hypothetical protein